MIDQPTDPPAPVPIWRGLEKTMAEALEKLRVIEASAPGAVPAPITVEQVLRLQADIEVNALRLANEVMGPVLPGDDALGDRLGRQLLYGEFIARHIRRRMGMPEDPAT